MRGSGSGPSVGDRRTKDPLDSARGAFLRDLTTFHQSRGITVDENLKINGKEIDLYLLYQVVTSRGGWEKVNVKDEWDDLLKYFRIPKATNSSVVIKRIYHKNLELYEKIHFLGEDVDGKNNEDDEYDDLRHRRRYNPPKPTNPPPLPTSTQSNLSDPIREELLRRKSCLTGEYERLVLSLSSPLPNEQDMAISVCTLLSNETRHAINFSKGPALMDLLLAHAGIFNHCNTRILMEETYERGRGLNFQDFWRRTVTNADVRELLCECSLERYQATIGINAGGSLDEESYEEEYEEPQPQATEEEPLETVDGGSRVSGLSQDESKASIGEDGCEEKKRREEEEEEEEEGEEIQGPDVEKEAIWDLLDKDLSASNVDCESCCPRCPCLRQPTVFDSIPEEEKMEINSLENYTKSTEKIGQRILQVASIIRNLSFDKVNAEVMGQNTHLLRFILVSAQCSYGCLSQLSLDTLGNIARYMRLEDPVENPYFSMALSLVAEGLFSPDRFRVLRSLETLREWSREEENEPVLSRLLDRNFLRRLTDLLTLNDIMLLIYALEALLAISSLAQEGLPDQLAHVQGAIDTLLALVTVEAQSYGPTGCIHMRVVETLVGHPALHQLPPQPHPPENPPVASQQPPAPTSSPITTISQLPKSIPKEGVSNPPALISTPPPLSMKIEKQSPSAFIHATPILISNPPPLQPIPINQTREETSVNTRCPQNGIHPQSPPPLLKAQPHLPFQEPQAQAFLPSLSLVSPGGVVSEEAWAVAWAKGAFEEVAGCSIEQGKMYRMYSSARNQPTTTLSLEQFINSLKCTYGAGIGPAVKNFGGAPLLFVEGLRPKMTNVGLGGTPQPIKTISAEVKLRPSTEEVKVDECVGVGRESKTASPILKATLSRPPKGKSAQGGKKKGKGKRSGNDSNLPKPTSSAIRSLLASKVTQRQQKRLQASETKRGGGKSARGSRKTKEPKVNGVEVKDEPLSSPSSSAQSSASTDSSHPPTSFQGILSNGINSDESGDSKDEHKSPKFKGMLVDLLERKVIPRENLNGLVSNRDLRISDRGLELFDKIEKGENHIRDLTHKSTLKEQMTFYSASDLPNRISAEPIPKPIPAPETVLMSGGGEIAHSPSDIAHLSIDDAELLEKFNEIRDLIVVPPEQFGLKRTRSASSENSVGSTADQPPPAKKRCDSVPNGSAQAEHQEHANNGVERTESSTPLSPRFSTPPPADGPKEFTYAISSVMTSATPKDSPQPARAVTLPLRLAVNHPSSNQFTFARQLVFSPGQQILLQTPNNQSIHSAKVIFTKPVTSAPDQTTQTYFIVQPTAKATSLLPPLITQDNVVNLATEGKILTSTISRNPLKVATPSSTVMGSISQKTQEQLDSETPFLCEWIGCGQRFIKHEQVVLHALGSHSPESLADAVRCDWGVGGCDGILRKRFSLMTHLQDRHCSKQALDVALYRRKNKIEAPPPPPQPVNHPGYAPNAAFHAIKRHALQFNAQAKELLESNEGPVTKSIRLTAALILKNLCNYSELGRRSLKRHESQLAWIAMSNMESSRTISQLLYDLNRETGRS